MTTPDKATPQRPLTEATQEELDELLHMLGDIDDEKCQRFADAVQSEIMRRELPGCSVELLAWLVERAEADIEYRRCNEFGNRRLRNFIDLATGEIARRREATQESEWI